MAYNPVTDFVGLWRAVIGGVEKGEIPGLDFVVAALARSGILSPLVVSGSPPVVNQDTTAWFKTAIPDYAAEGALYLWDETIPAYAPATPALFLAFLLANSTATRFLAIFAVTGVPDNAVGINGDFALRLDAPGGIYGPKAAGSWPADPLPGTSYSQISAFLDVLGTARGDILYRGASAWLALAPGAAGTVLASQGAGADPHWVTNSGSLDGLGNVQGSIIYRDATHWTVLTPGTAGQVLTTGGAGANPSWTATGGVTPDLNVYGNAQGDILYRNATVWTVLHAGTAGQLLQTGGAGANPSWVTSAAVAITSAMMDAAFGGTPGMVLARGASVWAGVGPGAAGQVLTAQGAGAAPIWATPGGAVVTPGAIGSYALSEGGPGVDATGTPFPGTWVIVSQLPVGYTGLDVGIYLAQRTA